jgi:flagellar basal body-associated protein FliL
MTDLTSASGLSALELQAENPINSPITKGVIFNVFINFVLDL